MGTVKKSNVIIFGLCGIIAIGLLTWTLTHKRTALSTDNNPPSVASTSGIIRASGDTMTTTGTPKKSTSEIGGTPSKKLEFYKDGVNNFTIYFPYELQAEPFSPFHLLNKANWRVNATGEKRGTPLIAVPVFRVDNQALTKKAFPLFYGAEVRIGITADTAQCYAKDDGYTSQVITNVTINGVTFKKFIFNDQAMQQYIGGASYRTIHNNKCYVIEQVRTGSVYQDASMTTEYTNAQLDAFYARTTPIVMSFKFTK